MLGALSPVCSPFPFSLRPYSRPASFQSKLASGLADAEAVHRTNDRLDALRTEGVHVRTGGRLMLAWELVHDVPCTALHALHCTALQGSLIRDPARHCLCGRGSHGRCLTGPLARGLALPLVLLASCALRGTATVSRLLFQLQSQPSVSHHRNTMCPAALLTPLPLTLSPPLHVQRISELCALCLQQLLHLSSSLATSCPASQPREPAAAQAVKASGSEFEEVEDEEGGGSGRGDGPLSVQWPLGSQEKAEAIHCVAASMAERILHVQTSFSKGERRDKDCV